MNSLKVLYKYILVISLMMLPISVLLIKFYVQSQEHLEKLQAQVKETQKLSAWINAFNLDVDKIIETSSVSGDQAKSNLNNLKNNLIGLRELNLNATLLLDGNEKQLLLNHIGFTLIPQVYAHFVDIVLAYQPARALSFKNTQEILKNHRELVDQIANTQKKLSVLDPQLAQSSVDLFRPCLEHLESLLQGLEKRKTFDKPDIYFKKSKELLSSFWTATVASLQNQSSSDLKESQQYHLIFGSLFGALLLFSFGVTLSIFYDMGSRIKNLTLVTKNTDPKTLSIETAQFGDDEIGDLAQSFETLSIELKENFRQVSQANEAKSAFVATVSHELRTPINGITGTTHLLSETSLDSEQQLYVRTIKKSSDSLLSLINNILDISKIESGKMTLERISFDLTSLLSDVKDCFDFLAQQKKISLVVENFTTESFFYYGDQQKIKQVLFNLVSNALKFTESGRVAVRVARLADSEFVSKLRFSVEDQGIGISQENISKLFNDFVQTDSSMARKYGGTGLGLSLSKKFAKLMGGDLLVKSQIGKGSEFWFELSLEKSSETLATKLQALQKKLPAQDNQVIRSSNLSQKIKILIAEDNDVNQMILQKYMKKWGYEFATALTGIEAIEKVQSDPEINLILMDCQMPEMDGMEATRKIRHQLKSPTKDIPIIALTANAFEEDKKKYLENGMNMFVAKPIDPNQLKEIIASFFEQKSPFNNEKAS